MTGLAIVLTIPQAVLEAALALHRQKNTCLVYSPFNTSEVTGCKDNSYWHCVEERVEFVSLEARNHCTALAIFQQVPPLGAADALLDAAHGLWRNEIHHTDSASGRLLGFASQSLNVLAEAAQKIRSKQQASEVFHVLHLIEAALPHLQNIRAEDIVTFIDAQHEVTNHDMAYGMIFRAIERRLQSESHLAWEIWHITRTSMLASKQNLYSVALQALLHTDQQALALEKARQDANDIDPLIAGAALWTLGRAIHIHHLNDDDLDKCIAILLDKTRVVNAEIRQSAIRAVTSAALKDERLISELVRLSVEYDDYTLAVIAGFLCMNQHDLPVSSPHFNALLKSLVKLSPSQKDAINNLDDVLQQLYTTPEHRSLVIDYLTQWVIQHGGSGLNDTALIVLFDRTIMQIANDKPGFQTVITRWLVAPEKQLAVACGEFIDYLHIHGLQSAAFLPEVLDSFAAQDFKFLARRLVGYVMSIEPLLALALSLLETNHAPARSFGWVYMLLTEEVGRDYPYATMNALTARQETANSPEKELLVKIHDVLLQRSKALDNLPRLQELRPPMRLRRAVALKRKREVQVMKEKANEQSIMHLISNVISIKASRSWFSVQDNKVGPIHHMQSISRSVSLPKRAIADPTGHAITWINYRIAKRDDE